jgi:hypothetical protein
MARKQTVVARHTVNNEPCAFYDIEKTAIDAYPYRLVLIDAQTGVETGQMVLHRSVLRSLGQVLIGLEED